MIAKVDHDVITQQRRLVNDRMSQVCGFVDHLLESSYLFLLLIGHMSKGGLVIPVILSGGSGTRLWPVSRSKYPKQFCELFDDSLQNLTLKRLSHFGTPMIVTSQLLRDFTEKKAKESGFQNVQVLFEPVGKNTAPAIAVLCKFLELQGKSKEIVGVFPADHLIEKEEEFFSAVELAQTSAKLRKVVTLGLKPTHPETGYGYIQTQKKPATFGKKHSAFEVIKFHEKPTYEVAKQFIAEGSFYWNAGIFIFPVEFMIELFQKYQPQIWSSLSSMKADLSNLKELYDQLPSISIDYAIMEKLGGEDLFCVPCDPKWNDVGSWDAVAEVYEGSGRSKSNPIEVDSKNNFVMPHNDRTYAVVGVDDLIVVDTQDALLISKRGHSQDVKTVVDRLKKTKSKLVDDHTFEERPWGWFNILKDQEHFKSKIIRVNPGAQISYQSHEKREEHWIIIRGEGLMVLNDTETPVQKGSYIHIPTQAKHRIRNTGDGPLEFIEVQLGTYFGEDDITRYKDDYKRV